MTHLVFFQVVLKYQAWYCTTAFIRFLLVNVCLVVDILSVWHWRPSLSRPHQISR